MAIISGVCLRARDQDLADSSGPGLGFGHLAYPTSWTTKATKETKATKKDNKDNKDDKDNKDNKQASVDCF